MKEECLRFESYDLQSSGYVRPSAILRRMQQIARDDLNDFGISYEDMRRRNMAFVVSKVALVWERPLPGERRLVMKSAALATHGATFPRAFTVSDEQGVCFRAMTLWALLDFEKRSLLRPSALWKEIPTFDDLSEGVSCARLSPKKDVREDFYDERLVYPSLLDQNCHLNNCNYADLAMDLLPLSRQTVRELHITFQKEAVCGERLFLRGWQEEDGVLVSGSFGSGEGCFLSKIKLFEE